MIAEPKKRGRPRKERYAHLKGGFWRNPKVRRLSLEARGLLVTAWSYAADQATDGLVPLELIAAWAGKRERALLKELAGFLVIEPDSIDARCHDWHDANISVDEWESRLVSDRKRKRKSEDIPTGKPPDIPTGEKPTFQGGALDEDEDEDEEPLKRGRQAAPASARQPAPVPGDLREQEHAVGEAVTALVRGWSREWEARTATPASPAQLASVGKLGAWLVEYRRRCPERSLEDLASTMLASFFVAKETIDRPPVEWLAEDPGRYLDKVYRPKREARDKSEELEAARQAELTERWAADDAEAVEPPDFGEILARIGEAAGS